jgi:hypothetical protein
VEQAFMPAVLPLKKEMGFSPCGKKPHSAEKGLYSKSEKPIAKGQEPKFLPTY